MAKDKKQLDKSLDELEGIISKGDLSKAHELLIPLLKEYPSDTRVVTLSAHVTALMGNLEVAKTLAIKASMLNEFNIKARYVLGFCHQSLKEFMEAAEVYRQILEKIPTSAVAHFFLAESLRKASKIKDALPAYQKAAVLDDAGDVKSMAEEKIAELKEVMEIP